MKRFTSEIILAMLAISLSGCTPGFTSTLPTFTPMATYPPTNTFTPVVIATPTLTFPASPFPLSTATFGFKRVSINDFIPNSSFEMPISFEMPQDYVRSQDGDTYFWTPQQYKDTFRSQATSYFQARLAFSTYDSQIDRFSNLPNDINDAIISLWEDDGAKVNRVERKYVGEFPTHIIELELSYEGMPGVVKTQSINRIFVATLVDSQVLWIDYYFSVPANLEEELAIWERFEYSFERNP